VARMSYRLPWKAVTTTDLMFEGPNTKRWGSVPQRIGALQIHEDRSTYDMFDFWFELKYDNVRSAKPWWMSINYKAGKMMERSAEMQRQGFPLAAKKLRTEALHLQGFKRPYKQKKQRDRKSWHQFLAECNDEDFYHKVRMTKADFETLFLIIGDHPKLQRDESRARRNDVVVCCPRTILGITLLRLGGKSLDSIGAEFGLHRNSVSAFFLCGLEAINDNSSRFIDPDPFGSREKLEALAAGFNELAWGRNDGLNLMENAVGALDGIVVPMMKPDHSAAKQFFNRKQYYSIVIQAMCDAKGLFTFVSKASRGAQHDSAAFAASELFRWVYGETDLEGNVVCESKLLEPFWILADSAYGCTDKIICPYSIWSNQEKHLMFNQNHSSMRAKIDCAFGMLVSKFQILKHEIPTMQPRVAEKVFHACACLHNFCRRAKLERNEIDADLEVSDIVSNNVRSGRISVTNPQNGETTTIDLQSAPPPQEREDGRRNPTARRTKLANELYEHFNFDPDATRRAIEVNATLRQRRREERRDVRAQNKRRKRISYQRLYFQFPPTRRFSSSSESLFAFASSPCSLKKTMPRSRASRLSLKFSSSSLLWSTPI